MSLRGNVYIMHIILCSFCPSVSLVFFWLHWCFVNNCRSNRPLEMTSDARQKCGNLHYAIRCNVIWANQKTESFEYHWLRALAVFDQMSFPAILSSIGHHFKFCWYVNSSLVYQRSLEVCLFPMSPGHLEQKMSWRQIWKSYTCLCEVEEFRFIPIGDFWYAIWANRGLGAKLL